MIEAHRDGRRDGMTAAMLTQNASHEAERVHALDELGVAGTAREERFDRITRLAQQLFCVSMAAVTLVDRDVQWLVSEQGVGLESTSRQDTICNVTIASPDTTVVEDASRDTRFAANPYVTGEPHVRFYAGHPLTAPGRYRVGTLCSSTRPRGRSPSPGGRCCASSGSGPRRS
jgi:GAF domain-containing protein